MSIRREQAFPLALIIIDVCAAIPYFVQGDWRRGVYWLAAAVLTSTVTF